MLRLPSAGCRCESGDGVRASDPGAIEPALDTAGAELALVGGERLRGPFEVPDGGLPAQEGDVDAGDQVVAELEVTHPVAVIGRGAEPPRTRAMICSATTEA